MEDKDWFVPKYKYEYVTKKRVNERECSRKSFKVKYCPSCRNAHETIWEDCSSATKYYSDFVTLGLERSICERCSKSS